MILNLISGVFLLSGVAFVLLAALGALRFQDYLSRMAAVSKASTLGLTLIFLAVTTQHGLAMDSIKAVITIAILWLTSPIAAHLIGRAGLLTDERINPKTTGMEVINEIKRDKS